MRAPVTADRDSPLGLRRSHGWRPVNAMPRYLVERSFARAWDAAAGAGMSCAASDTHVLEGVTWLHSYITRDRRRSYCIVVGPSPEAVRRAAAHSGLPVDRISQVWLLDPHTPHHPEELQS